MSTATQLYGPFVFLQYGYQCWYCGIELNKSNHSIDHFDGNNKNNDPDNLRPSCMSCNAQKQNANLETFRLRVQKRKAGLPDFVSTTVIRYFEREYGVDFNFPEHKFFFEKSEQ